MKWMERGNFIQKIYSTKRQKKSSSSILTVKSNKKLIKANLILTKSGPASEINLNWSFIWCCCNYSAAKWNWNQELLDCETKLNKRSHSTAKTFLPCSFPTCIVGKFRFHSLQKLQLALAQRSFLLWIGSLCMDGDIGRWLCQKICYISGLYFPPALFRISRWNRIYSQGSSLCCPGRWHFIFIFQLNSNKFSRRMKNSFPVEAFVMQFNEIFYEFQIRCMTLVDIPRMNCYMAYFWNKTFCQL